MPPVTASVVNAGIVTASVVTTGITNNNGTAPPAAPMGYSFDGVDDRVLLPTLADTITFTIAITFNMDAHANYAIWGGNYRGSTYIRMNSSNSISLFYPKASGEYHVSLVEFANDFKLGVDQTLTVIKTATTVSMQIDSDTPIVHTVTFPIHTFQDAFWVGDSVGGGSGLRFKGVIKDFSIKTDHIDSIYPIDDGWSNNPTIRDSKSGLDATAINFNITGWQ